jgi:hypothetical protein
MGVKMPKVKFPRRWKFGSIPEEILNSSISIYAKILIGAILYHSWNDGPAWPGINRLSKLCSCSKNSVIKAVKELEKSGFLNVERGLGKVNIYEFIEKTTPSQGQVQTQPVPGEDHTTPSQGLPPLPPRDSNETQRTRLKNELAPPKSAAPATPQGLFVDWFKTAYLDEFGKEKPYADKKGDYVVAATLLKIFSPKMLKKLIRVAWKTPDRKDFSIRRASMTVTGFSAIVNQLTLPKEKIENSTSTGALALHRKWAEIQNRENRGGTF